MTLESEMRTRLRWVAMVRQKRPSPTSLSAGRTGYTLARAELDQCGGSVNSHTSA